MAEAWVKHLAGDIFEAYSAGTEEYPEVKPFAVKVMEEVGIDMSAQYPKLISEIPEEVDILISMGCGVSCPFMPNSYQEDWGLEDPSGGPIEDYRNTRNLIKKKVIDLIDRVRKNPAAL